MFFPRVTGFCFCFGLQPGAKIIAWLEMISMIMAFFFSFMITLDLEKDPTDPFPRSSYDVLFATHMTIQTFCCLHGIASLLLLVGAYKKCKRLLTIWTMTSTIGLTLTWLAYVNFDGVYSARRNFRAMAINAAATIVTAPIRIYFMIVVRSFRSEIMNKPTFLESVR